MLGTNRKRLIHQYIASATQVNPAAKENSTQKLSSKENTRMNMVTNCLYVFAIIVAISLLQDAEASKRRYHFPSDCTCQFKNLRGARNCNESICYPDNRELGLEGDCFPSVPEK